MRVIELGQAHSPRNQPRSHGFALSHEPIGLTIALPVRD